MATVNHGDQIVFFFISGLARKRVERQRIRPSLWKGAEGWNRKRAPRNDFKAGSCKILKNRNPPRKTLWGRGGYLSKAKKKKRNCLIRFFLMDNSFTYFQRQFSNLLTSACPAIAALLWKGFLYLHKQWLTVNTYRYRWECNGHLGVINKSMIQNFLVNMCSHKRAAF